MEYQTLAQQRHLQLLGRSVDLTKRISGAMNRKITEVGGAKVTCGTSRSTSRHHCMQLELECGWRFLNGNVSRSSAESLWAIFCLCHNLNPS